MSFPDAPPPLEDTGGPQVKDISGSALPGISKWAFSIGGEYVKSGTLLGRTGLYVGKPGDGRTAGVTLRVAIRR